MLNRDGIHVRPLWYLNHLQKHLKKFESYKIKLSNKMIKKLVCLPSSSFLVKSQLVKIINRIRKFLQ